MTTAAGIMSAMRAFLLCALALSPTEARAEDRLPILKAHANQVDIQDGDHLLKGAWAADPKVPLDVYDARRSSQGKKIAFHSDLDSISFDVQPGRTYDFIILLDGKVPCRTRISTLTQGFQRTAAAPSSGPVSIPISITRGKLHLHGRFNDSEELDLLFDTGADILALYPSALKKGARLKFDGSTNNAGAGGQTLRQTSSDNRLEVGGLRWDHEPVLFIEKQADQADGIVGYNVLQDKVVELDFDRMLLILHDGLPPHAASFSRIQMPPAGTLTAVEVGLGLGTRREQGRLILDTGGNGTLVLNPGFARSQGLPGELKRLGTSEMRGVGSAVLRTDVVLLPELTLAGHSLRNVPINVERPGEGEAKPPGGALFMEVLSQFHILLDYPRGEAYFMPNARFGMPFKVRTSRLPGYAWALLALLGTASLVGLALVLVQRRRPAPGVPEA